MGNTLANKIYFFLSKIQSAHERCMTPISVPYKSRRKWARIGRPDLETVIIIIIIIVIIIIIIIFILVAKSSLSLSEKSPLPPFLRLNNM